LHRIADFVVKRTPPPGSTGRSAAPIHPIVIRLGRLGDMVLLSPLLKLLHRRYRLPCWLIGSCAWSRELYLGHPDVARIWSFHSRHTPLLLGLTWWRVLSALRCSGQSPIYVCETATFPQLERIKVLLSVAGVKRERCLFLHEEGDADGNEHRIDSLLRFGQRTPSALRAADYTSPDADRAPRINVPDAKRLECAAWIRSSGWSGRPIVLIQPGNRRSMRHRPWRKEWIDDKAWALSKWSELLRLIQECVPQAQIVLCGTRQELPLLRQVQNATGLHEVVAAPLPLCQLLALCEVAHSMISVDTGPAHAAAAVGAPLIVLFGNSSPRHWLPRSYCGAPIIGLGGAPSSRHVNEIPVRAVFQAWRSLCRRRGPPTGSGNRLTHFESSGSNLLRNESEVS
jgi:ADP-heptose:LPS heptosyltransferase